MYRFYFMLFLVITRKFKTITLELLCVWVSTDFDSVTSYLCNHHLKFYSTVAEEYKKRLHTIDLVRILATVCR